MFPARCATLVVAALLSSVLAPAGASSESPAIPARLVDDLHHWIDTHTDLPAAETPATIVFADARDLAEPGQTAAMIGAVTRGLYDPETARITLVRPWSAENPQDVSVLLHELVHHRQGGKHFYCQSAKEHAAYLLQKDWLAERDLALRVNWIAVVLASSCSARDRHP